MPNRMGARRALLTKSLSPAPSPSRGRVSSPCTGPSDAGGRRGPSATRRFCGRRGTGEGSPTKAVGGSGPRGDLAVTLPHRQGRRSSREAVGNITPCANDRKQLLRVVGTGTLRHPQTRPEADPSRDRAIPCVTSVSFAHAWWDAPAGTHRQDDRDLEHRCLAPPRRPAVARGRHRCDRSGRAGGRLRADDPHAVPRRGRDARGAASARRADSWRSRASTAKCSSPTTAAPTDRRTWPRACGARVVDVPQRGYGAALIAGITAARGTYIIMGDADDSYDFSDLGAFVDELRGGARAGHGQPLRRAASPPARCPRCTATSATPCSRSSVDCSSTPRSATSTAGCAGSDATPPSRSTCAPPAWSSPPSWW